MKKWPGTILFFVLLQAGLYGQQEIMLENPGFEGMPSAATEIPGWENMGEAKESPPDLQPGFFGVTIAPKEGKTYLGLAVRETNTWEGVGQRLSSPLLKDSTYYFSVWLNRSNTFKSVIYGAPFETKSFTAPTVLKIWGYNSKTQQEELLAVSAPVGHSEWQQYEFYLKPVTGNFDELDLMAYYAPGYENQNGNLLIDNCSSLKKVDK